MLSKRYESTEVDRRTWLHVPSGTHWSTSSDTHQVRAGHTRKASRISKTVVENCGKGVGNFYLS